MAHARRVACPFLLRAFRFLARVRAFFVPMLRQSPQFLFARPDGANSMMERNLYA